MKELVNMPTPPREKIDSHSIESQSFIMSRICARALMKQYTLQIIDIIWRRLTRRMQESVHIQNGGIRDIVLALLAFVRGEIEDKAEQGKV